MKTIKIKDRELPLRIYSRFVKEVQAMLPADVAFAEVVINTLQDPVTYAVPMIWGVLQDRNASDLVPVDKAYEIYDDLIDMGKVPADMAELVLDICTESGFFDKNGHGAMAGYLAKIRGILDQTSKSLLESATDNMTQMPQKTKKKTSGK